MTDDPNADLVGYVWRDATRVTFEVTGTTPGLPGYVNVTMYEEAAQPTTKGR